MSGLCQREWQCLLYPCKGIPESMVDMKNLRTKALTMGGYWNTQSIQYWLRQESSSLWSNTVLIKTRIVLIVIQTLGDCAGTSGMVYKPQARIIFTCRSFIPKDIIPSNKQVGLQVLKMVSISQSPPNNTRRVAISAMTHPVAMDEAIRLKVRWWWVPPHYGSFKSSFQHTKWVEKNNKESCCLISILHL